MKRKIIALAIVVISVSVVVIGCKTKKIVPKGELISTETTSEKITAPNTDETTETIEETTSNNCEQSTENEINESTESVTEEQSQKPVETSTERPTQKPTVNPTEKPTETSTVKPTEAPTEAPTVKPTEAPTVKSTEAPIVKPTEAPTKAPVDKPSMTREEIIEFYLEGFNYARTHAEENRMGKSYNPVTLNETYSKYAQYYAEWLAHNMPNPTSVECHSGSQLGWGLTYEGITLGHGNLSAMRDAAEYMVDHIMFYGDTYNTEIGIGAYYKDGVWYVVFQNWRLNESNFPF
jgi:outer membrane biosynthesis protein TonB